MSQYQNDPIIQLPNLYINGLVAEVDTTTFNTINVSAGIARDSQNVMDITVGSANVQNQTTPAPLVISSTVMGAGGVDVLPMVGGSLYSVYVIADSRYYLPVSAIISLDPVAPIMPFGYDSLRKVGYVWSNNATSFFANFISGTSNDRFFYSDQQTQVLTGGTSTTLDFISLTNVVPDIQNTKVSLISEFDAAAAGDSYEIGFADVNVFQFKNIAPVAGGTALTVSCPVVISQKDPLSVAYGIQYSVSAGSLDIFVNGFGFTV